MPDEPTIPPAILQELDDNDEDVKDVAVDKAATPAERTASTARWKRDLERTRPLLLYAQRDSDSNKNVLAARAQAWDETQKMNIATSSTLIPQFLPTYIPRVFHLALPYMVGGPDFKGQTHPRRKNDPHSPDIMLARWLQMIACNCLTSIRWDWDLIPGAWSLFFASQVNTSMTLGFKRAMRRGNVDEVTDSMLQDNLKNLYHKLVEAEFMDSTGHRRSVNGDVTKMHKIIGLTKEQEALISNFNYMSSKLAGTRQMRRRIGHIVKCGMFFYGCPVFITVTPSERHSGLCIRFFRVRRKDPALNTTLGSQFRDWIGAERPEVYSADVVR